MNRRPPRSTLTDTLFPYTTRFRTSDWLVAILMRESMSVTPEVKEHLWSALSSLASAPITERTLTGLSFLCQSNDLKQALRPYCVGGDRKSTRLNSSH